jgi:hypothetical protein
MFRIGQTQEAPLERRAGPGWVRTAPLVIGRCVYLKVAASRRQPDIPCGQQLPELGRTSGGSRGQTQPCSGSFWLSARPSPTDLCSIKEPTLGCAGPVSYGICCRVGRMPPPGASCPMGLVPCSLRAGLSEARAVYPAVESHAAQSAQGCGDQADCGHHQGCDESHGA